MDSEETGFKIFKGINLDNAILNLRASLLCNEGHGLGKADLPG